jgi:hypothetical protein
MFLLKRLDVLSGDRAEGPDSAERIFRISRSASEQRQVGPEQGCQIFPGTTYQNGEKYTKLPPNTPNVHKIF